MRESLGFEISTVSGAAADAFSAMVPAFLAHSRETPTHLARALEADPEMPLALAAKSLFTTLLARGELRPAAVAAASAAAQAGGRRGMTRREQCLVNAAEMAADGRWREAIGAIEAALEAAPACALSAKLSHAFRFMLGDKAGMLASSERVLAQAGTAHPHRGYLHGLRAFSLEESGFYAEAEFIGRTGVDLADDDAWGTHAVSHVHEMMGRAADGEAWIAQRKERFAHCNNFGYHLFWHLALFKLELGKIDDVFALYDTSIRSDRTDDFRDIANGASLLARLELSGIPVGNRWDELADLAEKRINDRSLVFADLHYLLALLGAGRVDGAQALANSLLGGHAAVSDQAGVSAAVGGAMAAGILAYGAGNVAEAANLLMKARGERVLIGGSDAQRDIFEQIMLDCMVRAGFDDVAEGLLHGRLKRRGGLNRFAADRLGVVSGRRGGGHLARLAAASLAPTMV